MSKLESLGAPVALIAPVAKLRAATPGESRRAATPGNEGIPERNIMKRYSSFHLSFVSKSRSNASFRKQADLAFDFMVCKAS
jgi:hypothetical protein